MSTSPASHQSQPYAAWSNILKLLGNTVPLSASVSNGVTSTANLVTLSGTAPLDARALTLNGTVIPVTWTSRTAWTARVPFATGTNEFTLSGIDGLGNILTNPPVALRVVVTGPTDPPEGRILISEILTDPGTALGASWIELQNTSTTTAYDLSGWRVEGIDYTVPPGTVLLAGARLVIPSSRYLFNLAYGPQLPVLAPFTGRLNPDGEVLRLIRLGVTSDGDRVISELRYETRAPWPEPEPGASLQLIDPAQDIRRAANWLTASRTSRGLDWLRASATGTASSSTVYLYLENAGEVEVDDWVLVAGAEPEVGKNLIPGGDFEGTFPGTMVLGENHSASTNTTAFAHGGLRGFQLVASSAGSTRASALAIDLPVALTSGAEYTLSFWYRPKAGGGLLTSRLSGSGIKVTAELDTGAAVVGQPATPGTANTGAHSLPQLPALSLNEILAENLGTLRDPLGRYRPWLELHNAGPIPQSLENCFLSTDSANLAAWRFPAGSVVPAAGFLIVWLDGDSAASTAAVPHTSFAIGHSGTVYLSHTLEGRMGGLDQLTFESPGPDRSLGDYPDGDLLRRHVLVTPTPGTANTLAAPPVRLFINEWMADNQTVRADPADGDFEDWFELHNAGSTTVRLDGFHLSNSLDTPRRFRVPVGYQVPPGGFLLVWADGEPGQNAANRQDLHVDFKLNRGGDTIVLAGRDGEILDQVIFGGQRRDVSQGREPDGGAAVGFLSVPTPRIPNPGAVSPGVFASVELLEGQTEIHFRGTPGRRYVLQGSASVSDAVVPWIPVETQRTDLRGEGVFRVPWSGMAGAQFFRMLAVLGD